MRENRGGGSDVRGQRESQSVKLVAAAARRDLIGNDNGGAFMF
jgi:hypothetical protein